MPEQITNYKCPACMGPLHFDGSTGKLKCDYCDSTFTVEEIEKFYKEKDEQAAAAKKAEDAKKDAREAASGADKSKTQTAQDSETPADDWKCTAEEWTDDGMKSYTCPSCGAELMMDATTSASSCPYCGSPTIVPGQFAGTLKPEYIIPFKLDKNAAVEALKNHYKGKPFLPGAFRAGNHIEEIKGVYVPFWLYNGKAHASGAYEGTRSHSHIEGDYEVITTEHFQVRREGDISFEKIPADSSSKMPDDLMDSIEPYDYNELKPFSMAYLPGYMADKYDVSAEEDAERAVSRAKKSAMKAMKDDIIGYETVMPLREDVFVRQGNVSYALMPVWLLNTKWNGNNYLFAMNGQTGRMVGNLPTDKKKFFGAFIGIAAVLEILMAILTFVL